MLKPLSLLALLGVPTTVAAQTATPIDQGRVDREPAPPSQIAADGAQAPAAPVQVDAGSEEAPVIRNIEFDGTDVPLIVARAAQSFIGQPASKARLQSLAAEMSKAYGQSAIALFTIAIPDQDLSSGTVRVLVAEGHLETVVLTGEVEGRPLKLVKVYADRLTKERPTSRVTLERYLSLIRDIPGLKVTSALQMGKNPGGVRLILNLDYQRPRVSLGFDNRTTRLVKDGQFNGIARAYRTFREGDETQLNGVASVDFDDLLFVGLAYSTPIGTGGTRASLNAGFLRTRPDGTDQSGEARSLGLTISHPLIRSYRRNLTLSVALDGLDSENAAFGSLISTERSRALRIAGAFAQATERRGASAGFTLSKGLHIFGAKVPATIGTAEFFKVNGRASLDQGIGKRAALRLRVMGQWTKDPLPAVERFAVGGATIGRAFEVGLINADRGIGGLTELAFRPIRSGRFAASEVYGFADAAKVRLLPRESFVGAKFDWASAGAGLRFAWSDKAMLELEYAHGINRPSPGYEKDWQLSVSWRLNIRP